MSRHRSEPVRSRGRLLERVGNAAGAQADFEAASELEPGNAEYVASMGLHHRNQGRWQEALAAFDRTLQLDPARGPVYSHRGSAPLTAPAERPEIAHAAVGTQDPGMATRTPDLAQEDSHLAALTVPQLLPQCLGCPHALQPCSPSRI